MSDEQELPEIPEESTARIRGAFKKYRKALIKAEERMRAAQAQAKYLTGQVNAFKEAEAKTYARLLNALDLLGQYRLMFKAQQQEHAVPDDQD